MVDYKYKDLYDEDSVKKEIKIAWDTGEIGNTDLHSESITLTESLCSDDELRFGACEASELKFRISNVFEPLKGKKLSFSSFFTGHADVPFQFGDFTVDSDTKSADRKYRDITAYDKMYDIINAEVSAWYNSLTFPLTLKAFRDSFCAYVGAEQEDVVLINDSMVVEETIKPSELSGQTVIEAICEINGRFGHIGRNGKLQYVKLEPFQKGLYPSTTLFPAKDLFPQKASVLERLSKSKYISCQYEDFICQSINKLQIRQTENDIGAISGTGDNCYVVEDNFLVYGKTAEDLQTVADNLYSVIDGVWYRPTQIEAKGNPCYEVGDGIVVNTSQDVIYTYILVRTLSGIQALRDSYLSEGEEYRSKQVNGVAKSIVQLRGKTNELSHNVEETKLEIKDVESGLDAKITQTAEQIELKVSKGDVSAQLSVESEQVSISGNRFVLDSTNFSITADGTVIAKSIDIQGGTVNINTASENTNFITLNYGNFKSEISPGNIWLTKSGDATHIEAGRISTSDYSGVNAKINNVYADNIYAKTNNGRVNINYLTVSNAVINNGATISGGLTINNGVTVNGGLTLPTTSSATFNGSNYFNGGNNFSGDATFSKGFTCSSAANLNGTSNFNGDTNFASNKTHKINGTLILDTRYLSITNGGYVKIGYSNLYNIGFFGSSGSSRKTVSKITSTSSASTSTIATKVNDLITALQAYGLIG